MITLPEGISGRLPFFFINLSGVLYSITDSKYTILNTGHPMEFILCVIGVVMFIEGLPWFAFPDKMKQVILSMVSQPERFLRRFGFLMMLGGLGMVWLGTQ